jgi:hypothetical protein
MFPASAAFANAPAWSCENRVIGLVIVNDPIFSDSTRPIRPVVLPPAPAPPIARMVFAEGPRRDCSATKELALEGLAADRGDRRRHDGMCDVAEFNRQNLAWTVVDERGRLVQTDHPLLVVELDDELFDEFAADDAVERLSKRRRQSRHGQGERDGLREPVASDERPARSAHQAALLRSWPGAADGHRALEFQAELSGNVGPDDGSVRARVEYERQGTRSVHRHFHDDVASGQFEGDRDGLDRRRCVQRCAALHCLGACEEHEQSCGRNPSAFHGQSSGALLSISRLIRRTGRGNRCSCSS